MANPIIVQKKSTVAGKVPTTSDLDLGEIAINHADRKIYSRDPVSGNVNQIAASPLESIANEPSDTTPVNVIRVITQLEYNAINPKDANTLYFIKE
jgi:hypothetical protein